MNRSTISVLALGLAAILFLSVNIFASNSLRSARLDMTENGLYTLSAGSKRILDEIPEPIRLRFYFSEKLAIQLPNIKSYGLRVRELLEEYVNLSDGKIHLEVIDPEPFTEAEDDAVRLGIHAVPLGTGDSIYFGLVATNTIDDRQVVPFFSREKEAFLEYDLTRMLFNLSDPKKPVIGLISGLQMNPDASPMMRFSGGPQPWAIIGAIRDTFEMRTLNANQGIIPPSVDILLITHPLGLNEHALYAIDQFIMAGGRALVFVDPYSEVTARAQRGAGQQGAALASSTLDKLLNAWGVSVPTDHVIGDFDASQQVNAGQGGQTRVVRYLVWLQMAAVNLNPDDVVTADLGPLMIANAGSIKVLPDADIEVTPLISTGTQAMAMETNLIRFGPAPDRLLKLFKPDGERHIIAARLTGSVKSAFPDGPPKDQNGKVAEKRKAAHMKDSSSPISVIVVADSDLLHDQFWLRKRNLMGQEMIVPIAANADFVVNALDNLSGSSDLIGLRSRGKSTRPFVVVEAMRRAAEQKFLAEERKLKESLGESKKRIAELESRAQASGGGLLTPEQQREIQSVRSRVLLTRKQLRDVQHNLNREIDGLETRLKFANVGLMPLAVALIAAVLALLGLRRRRRGADANAARGRGVGENS